MSEPKDFDVTLLFTGSTGITVKAVDIDEAVEMAHNKVGYPSLCHQCSDEIELGDYYGELVYEGDSLVRDTSNLNQELIDKLKATIESLEKELKELK